MTDLQQPAFEEVELVLEGMTCAACAASIERRLNELDGVEAVVNYATETATVAFPHGSADTDALIGAVTSIGYGAHLRADDDNDDGAARRLAVMKRRLLIAAAFALPVVAISMIPAWMFDGWQWWAAVLSLPVVTWGAWPFHRGALMNARHGTTNMDTLISVGVISATLWSWWALLLGGATDGTDHSMAGMDHMTSSSNAHIYFEVGAAVTVFILLGKWLEMRAKGRAGDALRTLLALGAREATVLGVDLVRRGAEPLS
ncbi:MAG: cation transporter [Actinomycetota bacterium]